MTDSNLAAAWAAVHDATPEGERVARQLSMLGEDGQDKLMDALPEQVRDSEAWKKARPLRDGPGCADVPVPNGR